MTETDDERLTRLEALLIFKRKVHTDPIEVGSKDLYWLINKARQSIARQTKLLDESIDDEVERRR